MSIFGISENFEEGKGKEGDRWPDRLDMGAGRAIGFFSGEVLADQGRVRRVSQG